MGPKGMTIFEISGFDYVGVRLDPKSIDYGPLRAENRLFPVLTGNAWDKQKSDTIIVFYALGSPY